MQVAGIIAEWNPLHRGHLLPLREARRRGATHIVAILSGNYVQRGEPALCPWPYRTAAALHSGVDLVLQLPLPYATATAEHFAGGAVASLAALGCVDTLVFGSECGDLPALQAKLPGAPIQRVKARRADNGRDIGQRQGIIKVMM